MLKLKRVFEDASEQDGKRILVDRVWPRGIKKEEIALDEWYKELAPTTELRKWFNHDVEKWEEFKKKYKEELKDQTELIEELQQDSNGHNVTLLYAAKDEEHNQAVVLKEVIDSK